MPGLLTVGLGVGIFPDPFSLCYTFGKMLKNDIHDPVWFFDLEWVPDAAGAMRLYDLPPETTELEAMEKLWRGTPGFSDENPRPFVKYVFSRVVSISFLSRRIAFREGERHVEFGLHSLPKLPLEIGASACGIRS